MGNNHVTNAARPARTILARVAALAMALVMLVLMIQVAPAGATSHVDQIEAEFLAQFNAERAARGIRPFAVSNKLADAAMTWSAEMAVRQDLQHSSDGRAEIIGYGGWSGQVTEAFMLSPSHRNLVVDPNLGQVGIAVVCDQNDRLWVTAQFYRIDRSLGTQTSSAPSPIATNPRSGSNCVDEDGEASLERLYLGVFGRRADAAGLKYWNTRLDNGASLARIAQAFLRSPEYSRRFGALDDGEFVETTYRLVLGRRSDVRGRNYWVRSLDRGLNRAAVMVTFTESQEFRARAG